MTAESFLKMIRIKETIANLRSFNFEVNSPLSVPKEIYRAKYEE